MFHKELDISFESFTDIAFSNARNEWDGKRNKLETFTQDSFFERSEI